MHFALQIKLYNVQLFYKSINNLKKKNMFLFPERSTITIVGLEVVCGGFAPMKIM